MIWYLVSSVIYFVKEFRFDHQRWLRNSVGTLLHELLCCTVGYIYLLVIKNCFLLRNKIRAHTLLRHTFLCRQKYCALFCLKCWPVCTTCFLTSSASAVVCSSSFVICTLLPANMNGSDDIRSLRHVGRLTIIKRDSDGMVPYYQD